jgi:hypothetical protein
MGTIKIKGGTPEGQSLCRTCASGHIIAGFRASELEVFCRTFYIEREIRFPVRECTFYEDRRLATKRDMEEIGWSRRSTNGKPTHNVGFLGGSQPENENEEVLPVASEQSEPQE